MEKWKVESGKVSGKVGWKVQAGACAIAIACSLTASAGAQIGGKPISGGNPTPGTPQPEPPNLADRVSLTGCVQAAPNQGAGADPSARTDSRFVLTNAERLARVPAGTGGSPLAVEASGHTFRLEGIDSQLSPFVGRKVEISGEIKPAAADKPADAAPTLIVEFVRKTAPACP